VSSTLRKRYSLEKKKRSVILDKIKDMLDAQGEISFALCTGHFLMAKHLAILISLFIFILCHRELIYYEFALENAVEEQTGYPVDVRIINEAPLSFKFSVLRNGKCILEKDEDIRVAFQEQTVSMYYDFAPFRERYLKEALEP
jgi:hypothetical protein